MRQLQLGGQHEHPLVARAVLADQPRAIHGDEHRLVVLAHVVDRLVERALEEGRIERNDRPHSAEREARRERDRVLLRDPDVKEAVRELGLELRQAGAGRHAGGDPDDPPVSTCQLDQLGHEDRRVVRGLRLGPRRCSRRGGVVRHRLGGQRAAGAYLPVGRRTVVRVGAGVEDHRRQGRAVEADLVGFGRLVAASLLGADMDDRRPGQRQRPPQRADERPKVVPRHDADVGDPEILEQLAGLREVDDRLAEPSAELEHGGSDERDALDGPVVGTLALAPRPRQLDLREVLGERTNGRADRHLVVVEHDQELGLALANVVERLERESAHQRRVSDDDRDPLQSVPQVARFGQPFGDGQAGARVAAVEHVMARFAAAREPADAVDLAERPEPVKPAGQQLVGIRLVPGVPHDPVAGRLEQAVKRERQLDNPEGRAEVSAGVGDRPDDRFADLGSQLDELVLGETAQVGRTVEVPEDGHDVAGS